MADSDVEIFNQALLLLGDSTISSFTEGGVKATMASVFYKSSRDAVLRLHPWNFAVKRLQLSPDTATPVYGYSNAFTLPPECLRLMEIDGVTAWKVEGRKILCDASGISIKYIFRNEDVTQYDSLFADILSAYIAFKISYPLTKSNETKKAMFDTFKALLPLAKNIDAQEEPQDTIGDFPFITVRG